MGKRNKKTPGNAYDLIVKEVEKLGQNGFSRAVGLPLGSIQRYLRGETEPTQASFKKLADYFGVSVVYLRGEIGNTPAMVAGIIGDALEKLGLEGLSEATGVPSENLQAYSNRERTPTESDFVKLSEYLEIPVHELRGGINDLHMEFEARYKRMVNELKSNEKVIDHLHQVGSTLVDAWLVENQKKVLDGLIMRQGQIVGELKEMGIDIFADPGWREKIYG